VTEAASVAGLNPDRVAHLTLAVNEAATNAIQHATGSALVVISEARDYLIVEVTDDGPGIPASVSSQGPQPGPGAMNGRGLWLIRKLCDQVEIRTGRAGTRVRLVMLLATSGDAGGSAGPV
jgi:anti-sigma regulatory factor (Ser/Thr protein kinase)